MIHIDGSLGGGQMLRSAISLSALTGKEVRITNIRKGKKDTKPGLRPQHLHVIKLIGEFCNAQIKGLEENSLEVHFKPWQLVARDRKIDIGTAGSISLLIQALLPVLIFTDKEVKLQIKGGTDVAWSPTINYIKFVFLPMIRKMGINAGVEITRHGFYPRGGGEVKLLVEPVKEVKPIVAIERGDFLGMHIESLVGKYPKEYAERMAKASVGVFEYMIPKDKISIGLKFDNTEDFGASLFLSAAFKNSILGLDAISERGFEPENFAIKISTAFESLLKSDAVIDKFLADQLLIYMALANGESKI
ncbi:MAG: RNA 3'-terminal phosphate cyclase, partial [Candidatus Aenigmarchaeota archaeon]|nr:RNA 3'-terminal phosphate cyclase [Candidatus Aenigmarchaeota archaeon]